MLADVFSTSLQFGVIAKAAITWTPLTFYITAAIVHTLAILLLFKMLHVDPEHNSFAGALIAALVGNAAAYFLSDYGLFGNLGAAAVYFATLAAVSSGEVIKSFLVFVATLAIYAGLGLFLFPRTPLNVDKVGGLPKVVLTGGIAPEPITEEQSNELAEPAGK